MTYPFPPANVPWTPRDICAAYCLPGRVDVTDGATLTAIVATMWGESAGIPWAVGELVYNATDPDHPTHLSRDFGIGQLNSGWHMTPGVEAFPGLPALTVADVHDPLTNIERCWAVMQRGDPTPATRSASTGGWRSVTGIGATITTLLIPALSHTASG